jgi:hypothetical protein
LDEIYVMPPASAWRRRGTSSNTAATAVNHQLSGADQLPSKIMGQWVLVNTLIEAI